MPSARKAARWDLAEGQVVLTVPASFDEVARTLTAEAAEAAGLGKVTLARGAAGGVLRLDGAGRQRLAQAGWRGDIVLVCDVGGGTADFSLIAVTESDGNLEVERISVGEHILLGGDNMDLALAYTLQAQLEAAGKSIDSWQFLALIHAAGAGEGALVRRPVARRGAHRGPVTRLRPVRQNVLDHARPRDCSSRWCSTASSPSPRSPTSRRRRAARGLQEFGLPYASDPVVSKHLAGFLGRSLKNVKASAALSALVGARAEARRR